MWGEDKGVEKERKEKEKVTKKRKGEKKTKRKRKGHKKGYEGSTRSLDIFF